MSCCAGLLLCIVLLFIREEAAKMWSKREAEWEKEAKARERLMNEVRTASEKIIISLSSVFR